MNCSSRNKLNYILKKQDIYIEVKIPSSSGSVTKYEGTPFGRFCCPVGIELEWPMLPRVFIKILPFLFEAPDLIDEDVDEVDEEERISMGTA